MKKESLISDVLKKKFKSIAFITNVMRVSIYISIIGLIIVLGVFTAFSLFQRGVNAAQSAQTYVILGWGGQTVGLANIISDGHQTAINLSTPFIPPQGKTFEAWLVDGNYGASGYPLSLGQFDEKGILRYKANLVNTYTYTDLAVTVEPKDDLDPKPATSDQVGVAVFSSPYGK
jgi:anti-sigma-K factor RskA